MKPGAIGDGHAPHLNVVVFMRGLLSHAFTRIYFSDEAQANEADPVLAQVPADRRATLIAAREDTGEGVSSTGSISTCRAMMKPCFSMSDGEV